jgi:pimeloyl-ACP methyl ester carboxylesterase
VRLLFVPSYVLTAFAAGAVCAEPIADGAASFTFRDARGNSDRPITVWTYRPGGFASDGPVVFVMHGKNRNGRAYRDSWITEAERRRFLLLTPEFSNEAYPGEEMYQCGFVELADGKRRDRERWSLSAIEHLFDEVVRDNDLAAKRYFIYGHSGGGQFVHRLALLCPDARFELAIAANPGWYTMPDLTTRFPYGLVETPTDIAQLKLALSRRLVILLGDKDTDPNHAALRRSREAMQQGAHRFERGHAFFRKGQSAARELETEFNWQLVPVAGVAHDNAKMAPAAAEIIGKQSKVSKQQQQIDSPPNKQ